MTQSELIALEKKGCRRFRRAERRPQNSMSGSLIAR